MSALNATVLGKSDGHSRQEFSAINDGKSYKNGRAMKEPIGQHPIRPVLVPISSNAFLLPPVIDSHEDPHSDLLNPLLYSTVFFYFFAERKVSLFKKKKTNCKNTNYLKIYSMEKKYLLECMVVTWETSHFEISALNDPAKQNTKK